MKNKRILTLILSIIVAFSAMCVYASEPQIVKISQSGKFTVSYTNDNIKAGKFYSIYVLKPGETELIKNNILFMRQVVADGTTINVSDIELKGDAKEGDLYIGGSGIGAAVNVAMLINHGCPDADFIKVEGTAPNCTESGIIEHYKCTGCNQTFSDAYAKNPISDVTDPATNHVNKEAFHGESNRCDNLRNKECTYCPDCNKYFNDADCTDEIEIISSHITQKRDAVNPTCTQSGNAEYYECSVCSKKFKEAEGINEFVNGGEILPPQHTLIEVEGVSPDCKNDGKLAHWHCTDECGQNFADRNGQTVLESIVIPSLGHTWEVQANGREVCSVCSEKKPVEIASGVGFGGGGGGSVPEVVTVSFETDCDTAIAPVKINEGKKLDAESISALTKEGFKFAGWYTDKELTILYDFSKAVNKNFTLYAKWIEETAGEDVENPVGSENFEDVNETDWFFEAVMFAKENGLMNGVEESKFAPSETVTRAMLVTVLYRMENEPSVSPSTFTDVERGSWYANAVAWASSNNITSGISEKEFAPNSNISREQIATMLYRYAIYKGYNISAAEKTSLESYTDSNEVSSYANSAFKWAVGESIVSGKSETTLNPKDNATRAETAALLMRICNKYN